MLTRIRITEDKYTSAPPQCTFLPFRQHCTEAALGELALTPLQYVASQVGQVLASQVGQVYLGQAEVQLGLDGLGLGTPQLENRRMSEMENQRARQCVQWVLHRASLIPFAQYTPCN